MNETQLEYAKLFRTPAGAVATITRIRQNDYNISILNSLASLSADPECWRCLRDAGIVDLFLDMILQLPQTATDGQTVSSSSKRVEPTCGK